MQRYSPLLTCKHSTNLRCTRLPVLTALIIALSACHGVSPRSDAEAAQARVAKILRDTPMVDGHNDLIIHYRDCEDCPRGLDAYDISGNVKGHTDLARWKKGGLGAQLLNSGWIESEPDLAGTLKGFAFTREMVARYPDRLVLARTSTEIRAAQASGRLAIVLALENQNRLGDDEASVKRLAAEGLRSNLLAYDEPSAWADGHAGPMTHGGLSPRGSAMVRWMQHNGILVDLSHAAADTMRDVLDQSIAPIIFSHSSAAALCDVSRNVPDDVLLRMRKNGGIVMVTFVPQFLRKDFSEWHDRGDARWSDLMKQNNDDQARVGPLMDAWEKENPKPSVTLADVADHIEHVRTVAGIDYVGIGSDFDGIDFTPTGLEDVSTFPGLLEELARRGWSDGDLRKLAGENFLRVLDHADAVRDAHARSIAAKP